MATDTREDRQARSVRTLGEAAQQRAQARRALDAATNQVRDAVLEARAAGVSVRRAAEVGDVSPSTVEVWVHNHRERVLAEARRVLDQAVTPRRRGWHLADRHATTRAGQRSVVAFNASDTATVLAAAYAHVLAADPRLSPEAAAAASVVTAGLDALVALPAATSLGQVLAAVDYRPADRLMAPLDRAARMLLDEPLTVWQAALLPNLRPRSGRATFAGVVGARQMLDVALTGSCGGHAPGTRVHLAGGGQAVIAAARWTPGTGAPSGYLLTPTEIGSTETDVPADQITAAAEDER